MAPLLSPLWSVHVSMCVCICESRWGAIRGSGTAQESCDGGSGVCSHGIQKQVPFSSLATMFLWLETFVTSQYELILSSLVIKIWVYNIIKTDTYCYVFPSLCITATEGGKSHWLKTALKPPTWQAMHIQQFLTLSAFPSTSRKLSRVH